MHLILKLLVVALIVQHGYCQESKVCEERNAWGFACKSCDQMVTCINVNGKWNAIDIGTCNNTEDEYCDENAQGCSNTTSSCSQATPVPFECSGEGIFPDPYNCTIYHACFKSKSPTEKLENGQIACPANSAFSLLMNDCVANLTCSGRQFNCSQPGYMARWPGSKRVFYVCAPQPSDENKDGGDKKPKPVGPQDGGDDNQPKPGDPENDGDEVEPDVFARLLAKSAANSGTLLLYPRLFRCSPDRVFSDNTRKCEIEAGGMPGGSTLSGCSYRTLRKDPSDCRSYTYCNRENKQVKVMCPPGSFFNESTQSCSLGNC